MTRAPEAKCAHRWQKVVPADKKEQALYQCRVCGSVQRKGKTLAEKAKRGP